MKSSIIRRGMTRSQICLWGRFLLPVSVVCAVTWLSLAPSEGLPQGEALHLLIWLHRSIGCAPDKIAHAAMYFCVCGVMLIALPLRVFRLRGCLAAFIFAVSWGVLMEIAQAGATALGWTTRAFDFYDMLANGVGAAIAVCVFCLLRTFYRRKVCA